MKVNESSAIVNTAGTAPSALLVPYSEHHVDKYHQWMKDPELQTLTASEPLSLEEEYAMQRSWRTDKDKLTFIICRGDVRQSSEEHSITAQLYDGPDYMIGDINLFLVDDDDEVEENQATVNSIQTNKSDVIGEVEIMIAKPTTRGQGFGQAALVMFLWYIGTRQTAILEEYGDRSRGRQLRYLRVKVDAGNSRSIKLFERNGFKKASEMPNYFGEIELRLDTTDDGWHRRWDVDGRNQAVVMAYNGAKA